MLCILTQDGSVYLIDDEMNLEPKYMKDLSHIKILSIDITDTFVVILDYKHHCYIWKGYEEIIAIKYHSDFSYIERIGAANDYFVCYDFSGLLGYGKLQNEELQRIPFDYTHEQIDSFECGDNMICILDKKSNVYFYNELEGIFKVKLNDSITAIKFIKSNILLFSSDMKKVHILSNASKSYCDIKKISNLVEKVYIINNNCSLYSLISSKIKNSKEIILTVESSYETIQKIECDKEKLFNLEYMTDFSKQEDSVMNYLIRKESKELSIFQSTNLNSSSSFSLADSVLPVNMSLSKLNSSINSGFTNTQTSITNNTVCSNSNMRINKITHLLERIFDSKFEDMEKKRSRSTKRRIVIERVNSSEFSFEERDSEMLYNSSLGNEIEDTLSKKMEKYKRGFSGGMLMNRKLQSITEEDEKSVVNSMRKKKEDETNKETEQQFNIKVIETQSRNKEKGKDSERVKIIKSKVGKSELRIKKSMISPSNDIPKPSIGSLTNLKIKTIKHKEDIKEIHKDSSIKRMVIPTNEDTRLESIVALFEKKEEGKRQQQIKEENERAKQLKLEDERKEKNITQTQQKEKEKKEKKDEVINIQNNVQMLNKVKSCASTLKKEDFEPSKCSDFITTTPKSLGIEIVEIEKQYKQLKTPKRMNPYNQLKTNPNKKDIKNQSSPILLSNATIKKDTPNIMTESNKTMHIETNYDSNVTSPKKQDNKISISSPCSNKKKQPISLTKKSLNQSPQRKRAQTPSSKNKPITIKPNNLSSSLSNANITKSQSKNFLYVYHKAKPKATSSNTKLINQPSFLIDKLQQNLKSKNNIKIYKTTSKESLTDIIEKVKESNNTNSSLYYQIEDDNNKILYIKNNNIEIITKDNIDTFIQTKKRNDIKEKNLSIGFSHLKSASFNHINIEGFNRNKSTNNIKTCLTESVTISKTKEPIRIVQSQTLTSYTILGNQSKEKINDTNKSIVIFKKAQSTPGFKHLRSKSTMGHKRNEVSSPKKNQMMRSSTPLNYISHNSTSNYKRPLNHSLKNESILNPKVIGSMFTQKNIGKNEQINNAVEQLKERYVNYLQKVYDKNKLESLTPPSCSENENELIREFMNSEIKANDSEYLKPCESFISQDEMENFFFENLKFDKIKKELYKKNPGLFRDISISISTVHQMISFDEEEKNSLEPMELDRSSFTRLSIRSNHRLNSISIMNERKKSLSKYQ